jgi:hypothetical protein
VHVTAGQVFQPFVAVKPSTALLSTSQGQIAVAGAWMVMARVDTSTGLGTRPSPGKDMLTSVSVAPHLLYQERVKGLVTMQVVIATAPNPSSRMVRLKFLSGIV